MARFSMSSGVVMSANSSSCLMVQRQRKWRGCRKTKICFKKRISSYAIDDRDGDENGALDLAKLFALVRSNFGKDPEKLSDKRLAKLAAEALWLEDYRGRILKGAIAEVVENMFRTDTG